MTINKLHGTCVGGYLVKVAHKYTFVQIYENIFICINKLHYNISLHVFNSYNCIRT